MARPDAVLDLQVERAVAGGRMLARHDGVVVLVAGAIPGERVRARVERATPTLIWAETIDVVDPSPARRPPVCERVCGGMDYAHIAYSDQLGYKRDVLLDAFRRIGKMAIELPIDVVASPERGYRLRSRLHIRGGRAGFFREGTHELCDAGSTAQLLPETLAAIEATLSVLGTAANDLDAVTVSENVRASERVLHLEKRAGAGSSASNRTALAYVPSDGVHLVTGVTKGGGRRSKTLWGTAYVTDTAADLFDDDAVVPRATQWRRQASSFFQGNRYLAGALVREVLTQGQGSRVADLYAGVGLFAVAFASRGAEVVAVEGDPGSGDDLALNLEPYESRIEVIRSSVEEAAARLPRGRFDSIVLDPPRTGLSKDAIEAVIRLSAPQVIYVSCDPATLARDAAKLAGASFTMTSIRAFDLFPNTAHVETVVTFTRGPSV